MNRADLGVTLPSTIVVGHDGGADAAATLDVALALARRLSDAVVVVAHADAGADVVAAAAVRARVTVGDRVVVEVGAGDAAAALDRAALANGARVVVVGGDGAVARRLLQRRGRAPVLLVRDAPVLQAWIAGRRALRVLACIGLDDGDDGLRRALGLLRHIDACDITLLHRPVPLEEGPRFARRAPEELSRNDRDVAVRVAAAVRDAVGVLPDGGALDVVLPEQLGTTSRIVLDGVTDGAADLVVIGSHGRTPLARVLHGATEARLLAESPANVWAVPLPRH